MPRKDETPLNSDFADLLHEFNAGGVEYVVVGGQAFGFHAQPRYTKDIDLLVGLDPENAQRVYRALAAFGAPLDNLTVADLSDPDVVFQIGVEPNRIDILTAIDGVTFEHAWSSRIEGRYGGERMWVIGMDDLIENKRAAARERDLLDVRELERRRARGQ
jgi:predicted nucleotidyltransferase